MKWWERVRELDAILAAASVPHLASSARIDPEARLDGPIQVGPDTAIGRGATLLGPIRIGARCLIGNNAFIRGPVRIEDGCRIGFGTEIKRAILEPMVAVGPLCFVADSLVESEAFLGALVRTSNVLLNGRTVRVMHGGELLDTGMDSLGAHIGAGARLGVNVVILPGRTVPDGTIIGAGILVHAPIAPGRYTLEQAVRYVPFDQGEPPPKPIRRAGESDRRSNSRWDEVRAGGGMRPGRP